MKPEIYTTFALCRKAYACEEGYKKLAKSLGGIKRYGKDTPIPLTFILHSNGLEDALWVLSYARAGKDADRIAYLLGADYAARVLKFFEAKAPHDTRPRDAIATTRRYARGQATADELNAATTEIWGATIATWTASAAATAATTGDPWGASVDASSAANSVTEREWQEKQLRAYLAGTAKPVPLRRVK